MFGEMKNISNWRLSSVCRVSSDVFPTFLPKEVDTIKDPFARNLASRIQRLPVEVNCPILTFRSTIK